MLVPDGRVIMISGASRGIGQSIGKLLAERGYKLSLGVRDPKAINAADYSDDTLVARWDATDAKTSDDWVARTNEHFGRIDGIVMNAGIDIVTNLAEAADEDYEALWQVNFMGPLRLMRAVMPSLRASGHGRAINIVSMAGKRLMDGSMLGYSASKFAALSLTHATRHEGWSDGVRATAICPGLVDTQMIAGLDAPPNQFKIDPEVIAQTVDYALSLPENAAVAEILVNSRLESIF